MLEALIHRGPDDHGDWHDPARRLWLGQRRLAIIDLSKQGHQPMVSPGGRYVITYNGEVYNHLELRAELAANGTAFRGHSDTETVLAAIETWGLERALGRFVGMFAFGLADLADGSLYLVRDRMGVKPLLYAANGGRLAFASELSAFARISWVDRTFDLDAVTAYFRHLCVPAPRTVYRGVRKLMPAHLIHWRDGHLTERCYWDLPAIAQAQSRRASAMTMQEAADALHERVRESVRLRLIADVPLGCFLSGGVDSSLVTALMQAESAAPVRTFSVGFMESSHDESQHAARVARHLGTQHSEIRLSASEATRMIPEVLQRMDEPFADNSAVPSYALARFAREQVTVAMSGDGGDELFGGYPRYFWADRIIAARRRFSTPVLSAAASCLSAVPASVWDGPVNALTSGRYAGSAGLSGRVQRFTQYLRGDAAEAFERMTYAWLPEERIVAGAPMSAAPAADSTEELDWPARLMLADQLRYLPDDILTKVDRASMAVSLEAREPLLDHRIVEWSWSCPKVHKLAAKGDRGKLVMRAVLRRYVPDELIERPKSGFGLPMASWLRGELRSWADSLLLSDSAWPEMLEPLATREFWKRHLAGEDLSKKIWPVLVFLHWHGLRAH